MATLNCFCEDGMDLSSVNCNQMYDCLHRNDEDLHFCNITASNDTLNTIRRAQENPYYNR